MVIHHQSRRNNAPLLTDLPRSQSAFLQSPVLPKHFLSRMLRELSFMCICLYLLCRWPSPTLKLRRSRPNSVMWCHRATNHWHIRLIPNPKP